MRFKGETLDQFGERAEKNWFRQFALFPHQMHNGEWVWLEVYEVRLRMTPAGRCVWEKRPTGSNWNVPFDTSSNLPAPPPRSI